MRQLVTLASLVEKETGAGDERPLVAAVYRNRLRIGMAMQADPTVIYALQKAGQYDGNLTREDLQFDSPYNTYRYAGLPPGPIAVARPRVAAGGGETGGCRLSVFRQQERRHARLRVDARRAQPQRLHLAGGVLPEATQADQIRVPEP